MCLACNTYIICNGDVRTMSGGSVQADYRINEETQPFRCLSDDGHESAFLGLFKKMLKSIAYVLRFADHSV